MIPESIFNAGIGDLFVIRVAGNVMDDHQLGSVEYAASHLGVKLIVVLGHNHCGAVDAAINHDPDGYIKMNGIAVMPEYRRLGIGEQLVERAERAARERGANSIGAASSFKRTESQAMLDKLGYQKSAFWFHKTFFPPR